MNSGKKTNPIDQAISKLSYEEQKAIDFFAKTKSRQICRAFRHPDIDRYTKNVFAIIGIGFLVQGLDSNSKIFLRDKSIFSTGLKIKENLFEEGKNGSTTVNNDEKGNISYTFNCQPITDLFAGKIVAASPTSMLKSRGNKCLDYMIKNWREHQIKFFEYNDFLSDHYLSSDYEYNTEKPHRINLSISLTEYAQKALEVLRETRRIYTDTQTSDSSLFISEESLKNIQDHLNDKVIPFLSKKSFQAMQQNLNKETTIGTEANTWISKLSEEKPNIPPEIIEGHIAFLSRCSYETYEQLIKFVYQHINGKNLYSGKSVSKESLITEIKQENPNISPQLIDNYVDYLATCSYDQYFDSLQYIQQRLTGKTDIPKGTTHKEQWSARMKETRSNLPPQKIENYVNFLSKCSFKEYKNFLISKKERDDIAIPKFVIANTRLIEEIDDMIKQYEDLLVSAKKIDKKDEENGNHNLANDKIRKLVDQNPKLDFERILSKYQEAYEERLVYSSAIFQFKNVFNEKYQSGIYLKALGVKPSTKPIRVVAKENGWYAIFFYIDTPFGTIEIQFQSLMRYIAQKTGTAAHSDANKAPRNIDFENMPDEEITILLDETVPRKKAMAFDKISENRCVGVMTNYSGVSSYVNTAQEIDIENPQNTPTLDKIQNLTDQSIKYKKQHPTETMDTTEKYSYGIIFSRILNYLIFDKNISSVEDGPTSISKDIICGHNPEVLEKYVETVYNQHGRIIPCYGENIEETYSQAEIDQFYKDHPEELPELSDQLDFFGI